MIVGLIAFILYLYFFVGFGELLYVLENLNSVDYVVFYSLAIAATVLNVFIVAAAWHDLLNSLSVKTKLRSVFLYSWVGYFVDLLVPCQAVCGEVTRIYLVHKENRESYGPVAASSLTNRMLTYVISAVGLLVGIILLLTKAGEVPIYILELLVGALIGTGIYLAALFYLAIEEQAAGKMAALLFRVLGFLRLNKYFAADLPDRTQNSLLVLHQGFETFRNKPRCLLKPLFYQVLSLLLSLSVYVFVFYSLGLRSLDFDFFIVVYFIVGSIQVAAAVFSVGALDIALANLFVFYGVPDIGFGAIAATLLRFLTFWMPILVGYVTVQAIGARRLLNPKDRQTIAVQETIESESASLTESKSEDALSKA
jgi:uncharacterized protein (TIRG00374 family)